MEPPTTVAVHTLFNLVYLASLILNAASLLLANIAKHTATILAAVHAKAQHTYVALGRRRDRRESAAAAAACELLSEEETAAREEAAALSRRSSSNRHSSRKSGVVERPSPAAAPPARANRVALARQSAKCENAPPLRKVQPSRSAGGSPLTTHRTAKVGTEVEETKPEPPPASPHATELLDQPTISAIARVGALVAAIGLEVPPFFTCPITQDVFCDPVVTADGHTFERHAIEEWLRAHNTSPLTGERLAHSGLTPNVMARCLIHEWIEKTPQLRLALARAKVPMRGLIVA